MLAQVTQTVGLEQIADRRNLEAGAARREAIGKNEMEWPPLQRPFEFRRPRPSHLLMVYALAPALAEALVLVKAWARAAEIPMIVSAYVHTAVDVCNMLILRCLEQNSHLVLVDAYGLLQL